MSDLSTIFKGTGSYLPLQKISNDSFLGSTFIDKHGAAVAGTNEKIISKFKSITDIEERRYAQDGQMASDLGFLAAEKAIASAEIDPETLDYIIVAHNFGDIKFGCNRVDMVPTLASRIKFKLNIKNPDCVAYDLPFGCPGWLQGIIQANYYIKAGDAKNILVIGTETLSRIIDPHDRDSMIYADGAGAAVLSVNTVSGKGILKHKTQTHTVDEAFYLRMGCSYNTDIDNNAYLKMDGHKVYEYVLQNVPNLMMDVINASGKKPADIKKVLVHQANGKMDEAILKRFLQLADIPYTDNKMMPMIIAKLGNSSVATIPTLLDLLKNNEITDHEINDGDLIMMVSVGAGMNINAVLYQN